MANYYQNDSNGLIYTADEARRFTAEQIDNDDLSEAMACRYCLIELFKYLPDEEKEIVIQDAIDKKMYWLFTEHIDSDDLIFAHDCPGHEV